jgi:hypothetical protein
MIGEMVGWVGWDGTTTPSSDDSSEFEDLLVLLISFEEEISILTGG